MISAQFLVIKSNSTMSNKKWPVGSKNNQIVQSPWYPLTRSGLLITSISLSDLSSAKCRFTTCCFLLGLLAGFSLKPLGWLPKHLEPFRTEVSSLNVVCELIFCQTQSQSLTFDRLSSPYPRWFFLASLRSKRERRPDTWVKYGKVCLCCNCCQSDSFSVLFLAPAGTWGKAASDPCYFLLLSWTFDGSCSLWCRSRVRASLMQKTIASTLPPFIPFGFWVGVWLCQNDAARGSSSSLEYYCDHVSHGWTVDCHDCV